MQLSAKVAWTPCERGLVRQNASLSLFQNFRTFDTESRCGSIENQADRVESTKCLRVSQHQAFAFPSHTTAQNLEGQPKSARPHQRIESDLRSPTSLQRNLLVLTRLFTSRAQIPTYVSGNTIRKMNRRLRIIFLAWFSSLFYVTVLVMHHTVAHMLEGKKRKTTLIQSNTNKPHKKD
uniref:Transmembrane protein n=1 Tax=Ascaris lumbricoides TaxID=6252 RepID=A0A0M3HYT6_ASCLU